MMRMAGSISKSTDVMKAMQNLIRIPEIQASMMELSKEMAKVWWGGGLHVIVDCPYIIVTYCIVVSRMCSQYFGIV